MTRQNSVGFTRSILCALALVVSGVASAQTLSVDNSTLNFTVLSGGFLTKQVNLSSTSSTTVFINTSNSPSWLQVNPSGPMNVLQGTPLALNVIANAGGMAPGASQTGTFTIGIESSNITPITVTVNLLVSGPSALSTSSPAPSFTVTVGTLESNVPTQAVTISGTAPFNFSVSETTQDGIGWLIPFTTSGNTASAATITIGVNPAGLQAGMYQGTVYVQSTTSADSTSIGVTLTVTAPASVSVTPSGVQTFLYQIGTTPQTGQLTQTLMVSSSAALTPFSASVSPAVPWLVVSPPNGATGAGGAAVPLTLTVNPTGLMASVYTTDLDIAAIGGIALAPIPVTLVVSTNPLLQLSTNVVNLSANFGATVSVSQAVQITTLGSGADGFTVTSDSPWLTTSSTGNTTPATLTIMANPSGLAVGPYIGHIRVQPTSSDANLYSLAITVNFAVGSTTTLTAGPPLLVFSAQTGLTSTSQLVELTAVGQPATFSLATSSTISANCPANWLSATSATNSVSASAPVTLTVNAITANMGAGVCPGTVTITYPAGGANPSTVSIPVSAEIGASPVLTVNMGLGFGTFTAVQNGPTQNASITIDSSPKGTPLTFSAAASSTGSAWLSVATNVINGVANTPQQVFVQIVPGNLAPNVYNGTITISSTSLPSSPLTIPVTLTINPSVVVTLSNTGPLNFSQAQNGPLPAAQSITLASAGGTASFQTSVPTTPACSWLQISPASGPATGAVAFTPLANSLPQNVYTCPVTFSFLNSASAAVVVNAVLTVGAAQTVSTSLSTLGFAFQAGGAAPVPQALSVSSTGGPVNFTVGTASSGGWLTTNAGTGTLTTPATFNVSIIPANIPSTAVAGQTIQGSITISAPGVLATPIFVPVSLILVAAATPAPVSIFNSATGALGTGIAPGELITLKGINLGPSTPAGGTSFSVSPNGTVNSTLAGVQVMFGNVAGTPTYVSSTQINVVVPWEISGQNSTNIVVMVNGAQSAPISENVVTVAPGVYTLNATGEGQAAALNSNLSVNGPVGGVPVTGGTVVTTPAVQGSEIAVYGTGGGLTNPAGVDGTLNSGISLMPLNNWVPGSSVVTATIGGKPATVLFAGAAPALITGVWQINVQVPTGLTSGPQPLVFTIAGQQTQSNVTIAVQ
jgi:trimeric autotransporter adhesin